MSKRNLHFKLRKLKLEAKKWSKNQENVDSAITHWEDLQYTADKEDWNDVRKMEIHNKLYTLYDQRASMLKQRAHINWTLHGDRISKFFHQCVLSRKSIISRNL